MFRFIRVKWSRKNVSILKVNNRKINFVHFLRTTFKILTGEIDATSGNAVINGFDINKSRFNAIRNLGFCPQYDYLPEYLTYKFMKHERYAKNSQFFSIKFSTKNTKDMQKGSNFLFLK